MQAVDPWKFWHVLHLRHVFCNPATSHRFNRVIRIIPLAEGAKVLDIASGKGEFVVRLIERFGVDATAVDISPYCIEDMERKAAERIEKGSMKIICQDAKTIEFPKESFDFTSCLGASWIYGGHEGTVKALNKWTKPGGLILVGEPYWVKEPDAEALAKTRTKREEFGLHRDNAEAGRKLGLTLTNTFCFPQEDWDEYIALNRQSFSDYARVNPDDPDLEEIDQKLRVFEQEYKDVERSHLGWAVYLFRKPLSE